MPDRIPDLLATYFLPAGSEQRDAELRLFQRIKLPAGSTKTTFPGRFDDLNAMVADLLPRARRLEVLDAGASSGVTSAEWSSQLTAAGIDHTLVASDLLARGRLSSFGWSAAILFDRRGRAMLCEFGQRSLSTIGGRRQRRLLLLALNPVLRVIGLAARLLPRAEPDAPPRYWRWIHRELALVSTSVSAAGIEVVDDDLLLPGRFTERFDAVRAANLITPVYFSKQTMSRLLVNVAERVRDGGLLIVCRTHLNRNHATIFRRHGSRLEVAKRLRQGSEIESLVLSVQLAGGAARHLARARQDGYSPACERSRAAATDG